MIAALMRLVGLAVSAGLVAAVLVARREADRRGIALTAVLPELPSLLRHELADLRVDARAAMRDGSLAAGERRRELREDLAGARAE